MTTAIIRNAVRHLVFKGFEVGTLGAYVLVMRIYTTTEISPVAPHAVRDEAKFAALVAAFEAGEAVNPVVVLQMGDTDGYPQAITGSHRIAAARAAGVGVPCIVIKATNEWQCAVLADIITKGFFSDKVARVTRLATRMGWKKTLAALSDQ